MNPLQRLTGATAVVVVSGLALAGIVLVAALVTDAFSAGNEGGSFPDRMSRIFGTDGTDEMHDDEPWDSEAWHDEIERLSGDSTIRVFGLDEEWDCAIDFDPDLEGLDLPIEKGSVVIWCDGATIYMKDPPDDLDLDDMDLFVIPGEWESDHEASPSDDERDSGRLPSSTEDLLETLLDRFGFEDGEHVTFDFADNDDAWSEEDKEESYSHGGFERWSEGPFTFEYGDGEVFTFRFSDGDGNEFGGEPERYFFDEPWSEGPFTFRYSLDDDDHEYEFELFDERWSKPDRWTDRYSFDDDWSKRPFSFRDWRDGDDDERWFPFDMFRDEWYSDEDNGDYEFDESYGEWADDFDDLFTEDGAYSFGEDLTPEQEELMRQMMQRMMHMFGFDDLFPEDMFDHDYGDDDSDDHHDNGDDDDNGASSYHDSDSTAHPARY